MIDTSDEIDERSRGRLLWHYLTQLADNTPPSITHCIPSFEDLMERINDNDNDNDMYFLIISMTTID
jgi:hypothetical protein